MSLIWPLSLLLVGVLVGTVASAAEPGLTRHGRWLQYNGRYVYIVGIDRQELACDPHKDYVKALDQLAQYHINKVRIFSYCYWDPNRYWHPWLYSAPTGQFDLDAWNPLYWQRVKDVIAAAQARDILVEFSLFPAYPADPNWWTDPHTRVAWSKRFNTNGAFSTNASGHFFPEFFDLTYTERSHRGKMLRDYQQALVDKAIAELEAFPNVLFEVANEFFEGVHQLPRGYQVYPWQQYWATYIDQRTSQPVAVHVHDAMGEPHLDAAGNPIGIRYFWDLAAVDVLTFHLYQTDPAKLARLLHGAQGKDKVLQCNESFTIVAKGVDEVTREAWGWFLAGGYYSLYVDSSADIGSAPWVQFAQRAKVLRDIAESVPFWQLSPVDHAGKEYDALIRQGPSDQGWQLLANPGVAYVAYFWGRASTVSVKMQLASGSYTYTWHDPRDGSVLGSGSVNGGGIAEMPSPSTAAWHPTVGVVLVIQRGGEAARPPHRAGARQVCPMPSPTAAWENLTSPPSGAAGTTLMDTTSAVEIEVLATP